MKKFISLLFVIFLSFEINGCGKTSTISTNNDKKASTEQKMNDPTQEELNQQLKKEAIKADFVKLNGHNSENKNLKVFAEGKIGTVDYTNVMDDVPSFVLIQKEGDAFGNYHIKNILNVKDLKDGENVIIYGTVDGTDNMHKVSIIATVIEKK